MAKNKKKRLVLDVDPQTFDMLKAMQRILCLNSAEEVLVYSSRMLAKAIVSDPLTALGAAMPPPQERDVSGPPPKEEPPAHIGVNIGDKLREAFESKK